MTCCLNDPSQRPETKLPVTYQTFSLVWTPILTWFLELLLWVLKEGLRKKGGSRCDTSKHLWESYILLKLFLMFMWSLNAIEPTSFPTSDSFWKGLHSESQCAILVAGCLCAINSSEQRIELVMMTSRLPEQLGHQILSFPEKGAAVLTKLRQERRDVLTTNARWGKILVHPQLGNVWDRTHCIPTRSQL